MTNNKTALFVFKKKVAHLRYLIENGIDISDDANLETEYRFIRDLHYGWMDGVRQIGYKPILIDNPNILVPEFIRRWNPRIYLKLLTIYPKVSGLSIFETVISNLHLLCLSVVYKPLFIFFLADWISPYVISICRKIGIITIEYNGVTPKVRKWTNTQKRRANYILSGYEASKLVDIPNESRFHRINIGISPKPFNRIEFATKSRNIDVNVIGSFDDSIFRKRSKILDSLLRANIARNIQFELRGYARFSEPEFYSCLINIIDTPVYGRDYIDILKSSKLSIVIPSDEHILVGNGLPMRIFQNAAAGCMQLVYRCEAVKGIFENYLEIVIFDSSKDLIEKINYYLYNESDRIRIAQAAHQRFLNSYTAEKMISKLFEDLVIPK